MSNIDILNLTARFTQSKISYLIFEQILDFDFCSIFHITKSILKYNKQTFSLNILKY